MLGKRRHPRGSPIAYIWIGTVVVGFLLATFIQDDDPNTDEGAGAGALIVIVGGALTAVYLALAELRSRVTAVVGGEDEKTAVDPRSWGRRNLGPLAACVAAVVVMWVASAFGPSPGTTTTGTGSDMPTTPHVPTRAELVSTIRAAASSAPSRGRRVMSVDCIDPVDTTETLVFTCAVTFHGPACQLWLAGAVDDPEPVAIGDPADGRRGWADEHSAHCE